MIYWIATAKAEGFVRKQGGTDYEKFEEAYLITDLQQFQAWDEAQRRARGMLRPTNARVTVELYGPFTLDKSRFSQGTL